MDNSNHQPSEIEYPPFYENPIFIIICIMISIACCMSIFSCIFDFYEKRSKNKNEVLEEEDIELEAGGYKEYGFIN